MSTFTDVVSSSEPKTLKPLANGKSGAQLVSYEHDVKAVLKFINKTMPSGKRFQRGVSALTQPLREVAYYKLAQLLEMTHLVPETCLVKVKDRMASAQLYHPAVPLNDLEPALKQPPSEEWLKLLKGVALKVSRETWRDAVLLDLIAGARDRHSGNVGFSMTLGDGRPNYHLVLWDNATTFGLTFEKYHNVFHKLLFYNRFPMDDALWSRLMKFTLKDFDVLRPYLTEEEATHAYLRLEFVRQFPYRLPWRVLSQGTVDAKDFPSYYDFFYPFACPDMPAHVVS